MNSDFQAQIDRTKELYDELEGFYYSDLKNQMISTDTRNRVQEILVKNRRVFDQAMQKFFDEKIAPNLTNQEIKKAKIYFPIAEEENGLKSQLGMAKIKNPEKNFPKVYAYLKSIQTSNKKYEWLDTLREKSNEGHKRLTPVAKVGDNYLVLKNKLRIGEKVKNMTITNSNIGGVPVKELEFKGNAPFSPVPIDPALNPAIEWAKICFEGTEIDILEFCKKVITEIEVIISDFLQLF